jgi:hypothetical protein
METFTPLRICATSPARFPPSARAKCQKIAAGCTRNSVFLGITGGPAHAWEDLARCPRPHGGLAGGWRQSDRVSENRAIFSRRLYTKARISWKYRGARLRLGIESGASRPQKVERGVSSNRQMPSARAIDEGEKTCRKPKHARGGRLWNAPSWPDKMGAEDLSLWEMLG